MKITSEITLKGVDKKDSHEDLIDRVVEKCFEIENLDSDKVYVAITLTTPENIREINKEFRNIDKETDVLSFPIFEKKYLNYLLASLLMSVVVLLLVLSITNIWIVLSAAVIVGCIIYAGTLWIMKDSLLQEALNYVCKLLKR